MIVQCPCTCDARIDFIYVTARNEFDESIRKKKEVGEKINFSVHMISKLSKCIAML